MAQGLMPIADAGGDEDPATADEVVMRVETRDGFVSYGVNIPAFAMRARESYATVKDAIPGLLKPIIEGALFALRHGPLQKLGRDHGLDVGAIIKSSPDKDAECVGLLAYFLFSSARAAQTREDGGREPLDFTHGDLLAAYGGIFRRLPFYDRLPGARPAMDQPQAVGAPDAADRADGA